MATPSAVPLPGKSHGRRSLVGYSPWGLQRGPPCSSVTPSQHTPASKLCQLALLGGHGPREAASVPATYRSRQLTFGECLQ